MKATFQKRDPRVKFFLNGFLVDATRYIGGTSTRVTEVCSHA